MVLFQFTSVKPWRVSLMQCLWVLVQRTLASSLLACAGKMQIRMVYLGSYITLPHCKNEISLLKACNTNMYVLNKRKWKAFVKLVPGQGRRWPTSDQRDKNLTAPYQPWWFFKWLLSWSSLLLIYLCWHLQNNITEFYMKDTWNRYTKGICKSKKFQADEETDIFSQWSTEMNKKTITTLARA